MGCWGKRGRSGRYIKTRAWIPQGVSMTAHNKLHGDIILTDDTAQSVGLNVSRGLVGDPTVLASLAAIPPDRSFVAEPHHLGSQVVFIDAGVRDLQTILAGIKPGISVVLLDPRYDALDQIAETLNGHHGISAVHIIADGREGQIDFSSGALSLGNLKSGSHASDLLTIGHALGHNGDLMIWSCDTGGGATGRAFLEQLAHMTGADVAGSTDLTGAGGNWVLEDHTGPITANVPLTAEGIHHLNADGLDLASLSIIYPTYQASTHGYSAGNNELGFSYGTPNDNITDDLFPGYSTAYNFNSSAPSDFTVLGSKVLFVATDSTHGRELWITDGSEAGTQLLKDIDSGSGSAFGAVSSSEPRIVIGSEMYFAANDGSHGIELWKTDGTAGGTSMVQDLRSGSSSSGPYDMVDLNGTLAFLATDGTLSHSEPIEEVWTSDGSTASILFTPSAGSGASYAPGAYQLTASGGHLYWVADDGNFSHVAQLYISDGTPGGTHTVTLTNAVEAPRYLTDINGTLFFAVDDGSGNHGFELWSTTDGTDAAMIKDINPGGGSSNPHDFVATDNGEVYFVATDGTHGDELWQTDGSAGNATQVADIYVGSSSSEPEYLTAIGNEIYFSATDGTNRVLWESNGTTTQKADTSVTALSPQDLQNVDGTLYFVATDGSSKEALFKFDGTHIIEVAGNYSGLSSGDGQNGSGLGQFAFLGSAISVVGQPDSFTTDEQTAVTGQNLFSDNGNGADTATGTSLSIVKVNGSAGNVGSQITLSDGSHLTVNANGSFTFDPNGAFDYLPGPGSGGSNLTATESFTYTLNDASSATNVTITVSGLDGNDTLIGTSGTDTLNPGTGEDTVQALGGADTINMGANLDANDQIDGGTGNDTVNLAGDYTGANSLVMNAATMVNVENLALGAGHSYHIVTADATVASGQTLAVNASLLAAGNSLTFNGSAETDGFFDLTGGGGGDKFYMGGALNASDKIDGGAGTDTLTLNGDYTAGVTFTATTVVKVEKIILSAGHSYKLITNDATVATGKTLTVDASGLGATDVITFDGSAETGGSFAFLDGTGTDHVTGGAGDDTFSFQIGALTSADKVAGGGGSDTLTFTTAGTLTAADFAHVGGIEKIALANGINKVTLSNALVTSASGHTLTVTGGSKADTISAASVTTATDHVDFLGGAGADVMTASAGADVFTYTAASNSTSTGYDTIANFNFSADKFNVPGTITGINSAITGKPLSSGANFDTQLAAAVNSSHLGAHHAVLFTPSSGNLKGDVFLIVDLNGKAGYQAHQDLVIHLTHETGTLVKGDFI